jgi:hypothetical protein
VPGASIGLFRRRTRLWFDRAYRGPNDSERGGCRGKSRIPRLRTFHAGGKALECGRATGPGR